MRLSVAILAAAALLCSLDAAAEKYKVIVPLSNSDNGTTVLLKDYDSGLVLDSTTVSDAAAVFRGDIDEPILAVVEVQGAELSPFILESGTISFGADGAFGSMLNDQLRRLLKQSVALNNRFRSAASAAEKQKIFAQYNALLDSALTENDDNALGYYIFLNSGVEKLSRDELAAKVARYPAFAGTKRVKALVEGARRR